MTWRHRVPMLLLAAACSNGADASPPERETAVRTVIVQRTARAGAIEAAGRLAARAEIRLAFKIPGYIEDIAVDAGDRVRRGQVLARLYTTEADAGLAAAQAAFQDADRDAARLERLYADSVVTLTELQDAQTARERTRAALDAARFDRTWAVIRAPEDGRILERAAEEGEYAGPGAAVLVMSGASRGLVLRASLPDREVVRLRTGARATVSFGALPDRLFEGRVVEIAAQADARTGTFDVEVAIDGEDLREGFVGAASFPVAEDGPLVWLPGEALAAADGERGSVFVVENGRAQRRAITIARLVGGEIGVETGLEDGARVITAGAAFVRDGDAVREVDDATS